MMPAKALSERSIRVQFTVEDLFSMPPDTKRYELYDGDLIMVPPPSYRHQDISSNLHRILSTYVYEHRLGKLLFAPIGVYWEDTTYFEPDLVFISQERLSIIEDRYIKGAPDLVIEILSSSTEDHDRGYKQKRYAKEGVREYWLVDPEQKTVEVLRLSQTGFRRSGLFRDDQVVSSEVLKGVALRVEQLWE